MKVLVTGASGFLGRYVIDSLMSHGIETVTVGRTQLLEYPGLEFIEGDLLDTKQLDSVVERAQATHLLHLAWYAEHGKYWASPLNLRWVEATTRLIESFCQNGGKHVVAAGTCAEYDWSYGYCREDSTPLNPTTLYGVAKDAARRLAKAVCAQHKTRLAWARVFLPIGKGENSQRLIPSLIAVFRGQRQPFGINSQAYRDFLHASDVAEGFIALLRSDAQGEFNISSGQSVQLKELVKKLAGMLGGNPQIVLDLASIRQGEPNILVGENTKLISLGWAPQLSLEESLLIQVSQSYDDI